MDRGYNRLKTRSVSGNTLYSWRFWSRGVLPDTLVCGIIRDSSDGLGRPYPLLIAGTGAVTRWQSHPDLLPFALEKTWKQMESLAVGRFADLQSFKEEVRRLAPPEPDWKLMERQQEESGTRRADRNDSYPAGYIKHLFPSGKPVSQQDQMFMEINGMETENPLNLAGAMSLVLKKQTGDLPGAFLMGGIPEKSYLGFFFRPLGVRDFVRLWSLGSDDNGLPADAG